MWSSPWMGYLWFWHVWCRLVLTCTRKKREADSDRTQRKTGGCGYVSAVRSHWVVWDCHHKQTNSDDFTQTTRERFCVSSQIWELCDREEGWALQGELKGNRKENQVSEWQSTLKLKGESWGMEVAGVAQRWPTWGGRRRVSAPFFDQVWEQFWVWREFHLLHFARNQNVREVINRWSDNGPVMWSLQLEQIQVKVKTRFNSCWLIQLSDTPSKKDKLFTYSALRYVLPPLFIHMHIYSMFIQIYITYIQHIYGSELTEMLQLKPIMSLKYIE